MYDTHAKKNNMWPQQHQQFMGPIPPHHSCLQSPGLSNSSTSSTLASVSASSALHQLDPHAANQRLDNQVAQQHAHHHPHHHHQHHQGVMELQAPSNPRASRNMAEKQRRDNLNSNISAMASLVPAVAGSSRRMDKISILRLAAAFLRSQYALGPGTESFLPRQYDVDLEQFIIENLAGNAGFFLVVNTSGKIVYISRHIEHQLGHAQHELLGQSIYNFVCPEDYDELERNLTPDGTLYSTPVTVSKTFTDENSDSEDDASKQDRNFDVQRRSFNIRMSQKALNKREHGQYEYLQISGQLRLANAFMQRLNLKRSRHRETSTTGNDVIFVGIARMAKKRTITELSPLEVTKDEYVTRHLVDGRIIFCDHRISVIAGYMTEEVSGLSAFKFMHKEDVRWTMIALRQMYDRGEEFGSSCYRLLSKTGQFIFLRTHGYLEFDKDTQSVVSFVCVNTLVSEKEGMKLVTEMKERFSAVTSGPAKAMITPSASSPIIEPDAQLVDPKSTVEDPIQLEDAITHLISDLPSVLDDRPSSSPLPDNQYYKAAIYSQGLPPASIQANKIGIKWADCKSPPDNGPSRSCRTESSGVQGSDDETIAGPSSFTETYGNMELEIGGEPGVHEQSENRRIVDFGDGDSDMIDEKSNTTDTDDEICAKNSTAGSNHTGNVDSVGVETSHNNSQQKRTPRKSRISQTIKDKERRYSKQLLGKNVPTSQRLDTRVSSTCEVVRIRDCALPPVEVNTTKVKNSGIDIASTEARFNGRKRSRSNEGFPDVTISKRKSADITNNFTTNDEQIGTGIVVNRAIYYANSDPTDLRDFVGTSPISSTDDLGLKGNRLNVDIEDQYSAAGGGGGGDGVIAMDDDLGEAVSPLESMDVYQRFDPARLLDPSDSVQRMDQLDDDDVGDLEEDLHEGMLGPSLEAVPDLRMTFEDLQTVIRNGKTIDEANVNEFTASDLAVNEGIRRSQFQLQKSIALRESQLSVLKRDLKNPALQAQRENFTQLQAEHNIQKQILKTLQQDHLTLQVNVQHNVGV